MENEISQSKNINKKILFFSILIAITIPLPFLHCFGGCSWAAWPAVLPGLHWGAIIINLPLLLVYILVIFLISKKFYNKKYFLALLIFLFSLLPIIPGLIGLYGGMISSSMLPMAILILDLITNKIGLFGSSSPLMIGSTYIIHLLLVTIIICILLWSTRKYSIDYKKDIHIDTKFGHGYIYFVILLLLILIGIVIFDYTITKDAIYQKIYEKIYGVQSLDECFRSNIRNIKLYDLRLYEFSVPKEWSYMKSDPNLQISINAINQDSSLLCAISFAVNSKDIAVCDDDRIYQQRSCKEIVSTVLKN